MSNTAINLYKAITAEAQARLEYAAFARRALAEGHAEIAEVFLKAAEDETLHGIQHLSIAGEVSSTRANLDSLLNEEDESLAALYPNFIRDAEAEGHDDAANDFRLALEREQQHLAMFKAAFEKFG